MNKFIYVIVGIAIGFIGITIANNASNSTGREGDPRVADNQETLNVYDLSFTDFNGGEVSLSEFKGKTLVVNSWAVWCPFCKKELEDFAVLQEELGDGQRLCERDTKA